jgi:hypothetical protein
VNRRNFDILPLTFSVFNFLHFCLKIHSISSFSGPEYPLCFLFHVSDQFSGTAEQGFKFCSLFAFICFSGAF